MKEKDLQVTAEVSLFPVFSNNLCQSSTPGAVPGYLDKVPGSRLWVQQSIPCLLPLDFVKSQCGLWHLLPFLSIPGEPAGPWQRIHSPDPCAGAGKHLGWEERECAKLETQHRTSKGQREGRGGEGGPAVPGSAAGGEERAKLGEGGTGGDTRGEFSSLEAFSGAGGSWRSCGKQLLSRVSSESRGCPSRQGAGTRVLCSHCSTWDEPLGFWLLYFSFLSNPAGF